MLFLHACFFIPTARAAAENQPAPEPPSSSRLDTPSPTVKAGEPAAPSHARITVDYFSGFLTDTAKILASPLHADSGDWLKVGGVFAITGGLLLADAGIRDFSQRNHSSIANMFSSAGQKLGSPLYTLPPVGAFYLYGHLRDNGKARKTSLLAVESLAITTVFTEAIKAIAQRDRPNSGASPFRWEGPHFSSKNVSFCSGHTSSAFSIATVFAEQYKDTPYVPTIAYGLATLAGLSRIYDNKHWASDAFFGAALGYFVGKSVVGFHGDHILNTANMSLSPDIRPNYNGLTIQYKF